MLVILSHAKNPLSALASLLSPWSVPNSTASDGSTNNFLRILAGTMTPRQTIRLSGVISCARHQELGQRLAVNSFTVVNAPSTAKGTYQSQRHSWHRTRTRPPTGPGHREPAVV